MPDTDSVTNVTYTSSRNRAPTGSNRFDDFRSAKSLSAGSLTRCGGSFPMLNFSDGFEKKPAFGDDSFEKNTALFSSPLDFAP
jgi:hypothetical protein